MDLKKCVDCIYYLREITQCDLNNKHCVKVKAIECIYAHERPKLIKEKEVKFAIVKEIIKPIKNTKKLSKDSLDKVLLNKEETGKKSKHKKKYKKT